MTEIFPEPPITCHITENGVAHVFVAGEVFSLLTLAAFEDSLAEIESRPEIRAVLLRGSQEAFLGDFDPAEVNELTPLSAKRLAQRGHLLTEKLEDLGKPVLAVLDGPVIGCGAEIALACSIRLATKTSWWTFPAVGNGYLPAFGGPQRLARLIGRGRALDFLLTGQVVTSSEAYRIGLINHQYPSVESLGTAAEALANHLASQPPRAVRYCLEAVRHGLEMPQHEGLMLEANLFGLCFAKGRNDG
ncbi:MAG: enoyl-CoA hydratase/isomerase family protein [Blastocatellia bacterium]|nr:enoyl-CoA hydratase/isomerase family protein [Blastocatellia bacterium]